MLKRPRPALDGLWRRAISAPAAALLLAAAVLLANAPAALAGPIYTYTLTSSGCSCGSGPFGTVSVTEAAGSTQVMNFTVTLNAPYQFHQTTAGPHPMFAVDINVTNVTFTNFKLNNVTTTNVASNGADNNVAGYGAFPYTLKAATNFSGTLTFTASVTSGTLNPTNIISNGSAYTVVDIINATSGGTGNVAAVNPPVKTPEPASLGMLGIACASLLFARRNRTASRKQ